MTRTDRRPRQRLDPSARREAIFDAAAEAFADRPYDEVTIAEIAVAAGASEALVFRYFSTKAALYAAAVAAAIEQLRTAQSAALADLAPGVPARDRLAASAHVYLDHIAHHPTGWAAPLRGGREPDAALAIRRAAREEYARHLGGLLQPRPGPRHDLAIWGYFGFLDAACLRWVDQGCPADHRSSLVDAALGALEGALGDWDA